MTRFLFTIPICIGLALGKTLLSPDGAGAEENPGLPKEVARRLLSGNPIRGPIAFSPDGTIIAFGCDHSIEFHEVATGKYTGPRSVSSAILSPHYCGIGFSSDSKVFIETAADERTTAWHTGAKWIPHILAERPAGFGAVAFSPVAPIVALSTEEGVQFWDWSNGQELKERRAREKESEILSLDFSADGRLLAGSFSNRWGAGVYLWDGATGRLLCALKEPQDREVRIVAFSPDGRLLACAAMARRTKERPQIKNDPVLLKKRRGTDRPTNINRVWEVASGQEVFHIVREDAWDNSLALSRKGWLLAACCNIDEHDIDLWDARTGEHVHRFITPEKIRLAPTVAFSPDGKLLATASTDGCLLWDVSPYHRVPPRGPELAQRTLDHLWADLASADIKVARRAVRVLMAAPQQSVSLLALRLKAVSPLEPKRAAALIADLDSDDFQVRERASTDLERLGHLAASAMRKAFADKPSLELRRRLQPLLAKLERPYTSPTLLRSLRALEVLEQIGGEEAIKVIRAIAGGAPGAVETEDACATFKRLTARRGAQKP